MATDNNNNDNAAQEIIKSQLASAYIDGVSSYGDKGENTETLDPLLTLKSEDTQSDFYQDNLPQEMSPAINGKKIQTIASMQLQPDELDRLRSVITARQYEDAVELGIIKKLFANPTTSGGPTESDDYEDWLEKITSAHNENVARAIESQALLGRLIQLVHMPQIMSAKGQLVKRTEQHYGTTATDVYTGDNDFYKLYSSCDRNMDPQYLYRTYLQAPAKLPGHPASDFASGLVIVPQDDVTQDGHITVHVDDLLGMISDITGIAVEQLAKMSTSALITQCLHIVEFEMRHGASFKFLKRVFPSISLDRTATYVDGLDARHATIFSVNTHGVVKSLENFFRASKFDGSAIVGEAELKGVPVARPDILGFTGFVDHVSVLSGPGLDMRNPINRMKTMGTFMETSPTDRLIYLSSLIGRENTLSDGLVRVARNKGDELPSRGFPTTFAPQALNRSHQRPFGWKQYSAGNEHDIWAYFMGKTDTAANKGPLFMPAALGLEATRCGYTSFLEQIHGGDDQRILFFDTGDKDTDAQDGINRLGTKRTTMGQFQSVSRDNDITLALNFFKGQLSNQKDIFKKNEEQFTDLTRNFYSDATSAGGVGSESTRYLPRKILGRVFQEVGKLAQAAAHCRQGTGKYCLEDIDYRDGHGVYDGIRTHEQSYTPGTSLLSLVFASHSLSESKRGTPKYEKLKRLFIMRVCESYFLEFGTPTEAIAQYLTTAATAAENAYGDSYGYDAGTAQSRFHTLSPSNPAATGHEGYRQLNPTFKLETVKKLLPSNAGTITPGAYNQSQFDADGIDILDKVYRKRVGIPGLHYEGFTMTGLRGDGLNTSDLTHASDLASNNTKDLLGYRSETLQKSPGSGDESYDFTGLRVSRLAVGNDISQPITDSTTNRRATLKYKTFQMLAEDQLHTAPFFDVSGGRFYASEAARYRTNLTGIAGHQAGVGFETRGFVYTGATFRTTAVGGQNSPTTDYNEVQFLAVTGDNNHPSNPFSLNGALNPTILGQGLIDAIIRVALELDPVTPESTNTNIEYDGYDDSAAMPSVAYTNIAQNVGQGTSIAHGLGKGDQLAYITEMFLTVINTFFAGQVTAGRLNTVLKGSATANQYYADHFTGFVGGPSNLGVDFTPTDLYAGNIEVFGGLSQAKKLIDDITSSGGTSEFNFAGTIFDQSLYDGYDLASEYQDYYLTNSPPEGVADYNTSVYSDISEVSMDARNRAATNSLLENYYHLCVKAEVDDPSSSYLFKTATGYEPNISFLSLAHFIEGIGDTFCEDRECMVDYDFFKEFCLHKGSQSAVQLASDLGDGPVPTAFGFTDYGSALSTLPIGKIKGQSMTLSHVWELYQRVSYEGASMGELMAPISALMKTFLRQNLAIIQSLDGTPHAEDTSIFGGDDLPGEAIDNFLNQIKEFSEDLLDPVLTNHSIFQYTHMRQRHADIAPSIENITGAEVAGNRGYFSEVDEQGYGLPANSMNSKLDLAAQILLDNFDAEGVNQNIVFVGLPKGMIDNKLISLVSQDSRRSFTDTSAQIKITFERDSEFTSLVKFSTKSGADLDIIYDLRYVTSRREIAKAIKDHSLGSIQNLDDLVDKCRFKEFKYGDLVDASNSSPSEFSLLNAVDGSNAEFFRSGQNIIGDAILEGSDGAGVRQRLTRVIESEILKYLFERVTHLCVDEKYLNVGTGKFISEARMRAALKAAATQDTFKNAVGTEEAQTFYDNIENILENLFDEDLSDIAQNVYGNDFNADTALNYDIDGDVAKIIKLTKNKSKLEKLFASQLERISQTETRWLPPVLTTATYNMIQAIMNTTFVQHGWFRNVIIPGRFDAVLAIRANNLTDNSKYNVTIPDTPTLTELGDVDYTDIQKFKAQGEAGAALHIDEVIADALSGPVTIDNFRAVIKTEVSTTE